MMLKKLEMRVCPVDSNCLSSRGLGFLYHSRLQTANQHATEQTGGYYYSDWYLKVTLRVQLICPTPSPWNWLCSVYERAWVGLRCSRQGTILFDYALDLRDHVDVVAGIKTLGPSASGVAKKNAALQ